MVKFSIFISHEKHEAEITQYYIYDTDSFIEWVFFVENKGQRRWYSKHS